MGGDSGEGLVLTGNEGTGECKVTVESTDNGAVVIVNEESKHGEDCQVEIKPTGDGTVDVDVKGGDGEECQLEIRPDENGTVEIVVDGGDDGEECDVTVATIDGNSTVTVGAGDECSAEI